VDTHHLADLRALLDSQRFAVLATRQDSGQPYASLVAFWASADLQYLAFCTLRATRKYANLSADGRVALLIDSRENQETDLHEAAAVTILGDCVEIRGDAREEVAGRFLARHPAMEGFVRSPGCAVMRVAVRTFLLVTRFQNVVELHPEVAGDVDPTAR